MPTLKGKWYFKDTLDLDQSDVYFECYAGNGANNTSIIRVNGMEYVHFYIAGRNNSTGFAYPIVYGSGFVFPYGSYNGSEGVYGTWKDSTYRQIEFLYDVEVTEEFYNWFTKNAVPLTIEGTWRFNANPVINFSRNWEGLSYTSEGTFYDGLYIGNGEWHYILYKDPGYNGMYNIFSKYHADSTGNWLDGNENYRIITFTPVQTLDPEFALWFYENAHSMELKLYSECYIAETADKIRECVNDSTLAFKVSDLANGVQTAYTAGYSQGIAAVESKGIYKHEVEINCLTLPDFSSNANGYLTFYNSDSSSYSYGTIDGAEIPPNDVIGATILWDGGIDGSVTYTIKSFDGSKFTMTDGTELMIDSPGEVDDTVTQVGAGSALSLQAKTVNPSASIQTVTADSGYDGLSSVTVNACSGTKSITSTGNFNVVGYKYAKVSDSDLVAGNIKNGVNILGVTGTYSGGGPNTARVEITAAGTSFNEGQGFNVTYHTNGKACSAYATIYSSLIFQADIGTDVIIHNLSDTLPYSSDFEFVWPDSGEDLTFTVTGDGIMDISASS